MIYGCPGNCERLFKPLHKERRKWCRGCSKWIDIDGIVLKKNWRCKCCNTAVRHTPLVKNKH